MKRLLIIDDDINLAELLSNFLTRKGYETETAHSGAKGIGRFKEADFDGVLCDYKLGDLSGKDVLREIIAFKPGTIVLIITGYSDIKTAVEVIKFGAYDYIAKPLIPDEIINIFSKAFKILPAETGIESKTTNERVAKENNFIFVGKDPLTRALDEQIALVAPTNYSVILQGESGTGKEVIARKIHESSNRKSMPFVAMDCGTLNKELSGSELFGHMKGSFTGAVTDKEGHFELANGGTLFLDEVGNLPLEVQSSLLRVIQERRFKRVGGQKEIEINIRIIVASNEDLQTLYKNGCFREDLYHRLNEFAIKLPPLRERKEDMEALSLFFLRKVNEELNKEVLGFEPAVIDIFKSYSWPGNIRELKNVIRRAVLLCKNKTITAATLPHEMLAPATENRVPSVPQPAKAGVPRSFKTAASEAEFNAIMEALQKVRFNKAKAAEMLHIDKKTLYNKLKEHSIKE